MLILIHHKLIHYDYINKMKNLKKFISASYIQKPGDSITRNVTLIPGEGIGRELSSKYYNN